MYFSNYSLLRVARPKIAVKIKYSQRTRLEIVDGRINYDRDNENIPGKLDLFRMINCEQNYFMIPELLINEWCLMNTTKSRKSLEKGEDWYPISEVNASN